MHATSSQPEDLLAAARPFYYILKVLGLSPTRCMIVPATKTGPRQLKIELTRGAFAYSIFVCFVIVALFFASLYFRINALILKVTFLPIKEDIAIIATEAVNTLVLYLACLAFVVVILVNRKKYKNYYDVIGGIDTRLLHHPKRLYKKTHILIRKQILSVFANLLIIFATDYTIKYYAISFLAANSLCVTYVIYLFIYFANLHFMNMILLIRQRFKIVNLQITEIAQELDSKTYMYQNGGTTDSKGDLLISIDTESIPSRLKTLQEIHFKLYKLCNDLNHIYGLPILLTLISIFINIISNMYVTLAYIMTQSLNLRNHVFYYVAFVKFFWALQYWLIAVKLTIVCTSCHHEYINAGVLLQEVLLDDRLDKDVGTGLDRFLRQIMNMRIKFTAFGFFDINYGLLCALAGAVTTYLVVLLQFQGQGEDPGGTQVWDRIENATGYV